MKPIRLATAAAAFAVASAALAQHQDHGAPAPVPAQTAMPGMDMPAAPPSAPAPPPMPGMDMPAAPRRQQPQPQQPQPGATGAHQGQVPADSSMPGMAMNGAHVMAGPMPGTLGPYPMTREASGTAWQPDSSLHRGFHEMAGGWMLMAHGLLNGVYDWQEGPRGDQKVFASGMLMGMAQRRFTNGNVLQLKAMLSPDPLMGKKGYPLHLAAGETANGADPLVDRQHPHDFFMELAASYSVRLSGKASLFVYGGLPGEPAFGPPAFMHRQSILDSPEAPITHHWLDSTHISFGVVTAGLVLDRFKIDASRFNGREPDQNRWDIETGPLDSSAVRVSFNPTAELSLQASWAHLESAEQLEPGVNQTRWSASGIYTHRFGDGRWWSTTLAWGRRTGEGESLDALALESALGLGDWTLFGRAEYAQNDELLFVGGHHGPVFDVGKASIGAIRDFRVAPHLKLGVGGLFAFNFVPPPLEALYAGDPKGAMAFVRLKLD